MIPNIMMQGKGINPSKVIMIYTVMIVCVLFYIENTQGTNCNSYTQHFMGFLKKFVVKLLQKYFIKEFE